MCAGKATLRIAALPRLTSQAHPYTHHPTLYNNSADPSLPCVPLDEYFQHGSRQQDICSLEGANAPRPGKSGRRTQTNRILVLFAIIPTVATPAQPSSGAPSPLPSSTRTPTLPRRSVRHSLFPPCPAASTTATATATATANPLYHLCASALIPNQPVPIDRRNASRPPRCRSVVEQSPCSAS